MASRKSAEEYVPRPAGLTQEDAHNLIALLNRVQTTGIQEAMVLGILGQKLANLKGDFAGEPNG